MNQSGYKIPYLVTMCRRVSLMLRTLIPLQPSDITGTSRLKLVILCIMVLSRVAVTTVSQKVVLLRDAACN